MWAVAHIWLNVGCGPHFCKCGPNLFVKFLYFYNINLQCFLKFTLMCTAPSELRKPASKTWTNIFAVLMQFPICRKLRTFDKSFEGKNLELCHQKQQFRLYGGSISQKKNTVWFILLLNIWIKMYAKSWFSHIWRDFLTCWIHVVWGNVLNIYFLPGSTKALGAPWCTFCTMVLLHGHQSVSKWPNVRK